MKYDSDNDVIRTYSKRSGRLVEFKTSDTLNADRFEQARVCHHLNMDMNNRNVGADKVCTEIADITGFVVDESFRRTFKNWVTYRGRFYDDASFKAVQEYVEIRAKARSERLRSPSKRDALAVLEASFGGSHAAILGIALDDADILNSKVRGFRGVWHSSVSTSFDGRFGSVRDALIVIDRPEAAEVLTKCIYFLDSDGVIQEMMPGILIVQPNGSAQSIFWDLGEPKSYFQFVGVSRSPDNTATQMAIPFEDRNGFPVKFLSPLSKAKVDLENRVVEYDSHSTSETSVRKINVNIDNFTNCSKRSII